MLPLQQSPIRPVSLMTIWSVYLRQALLELCHLRHRSRFRFTMFLPQGTKVNDDAHLISPRSFLLVPCAQLRQHADQSCEVKPERLHISTIEIIVARRFESREAATTCIHHYILTVSGSADANHPMVCMHICNVMYTKNSVAPFEVSHVAFLPRTHMRNYVNPFRTSR